MRRVFNSIALLTTFLLLSSLMSIKLSCVYFSLYSVFILCGLPQESSTDFPCFLPFLICWSLSCHLRPRLKLPLFFLSTCMLHPPSVCLFLSVIAPHCKPQNIYISSQSLLCCCAGFFRSLIFSLYISFALLKHCAR